jgi:hypothetical protein
MSSLADRIVEMIDQAKYAYCRLVLVVGPHACGKTAALLDVASRTGYPYVNVSLELSRRLLSVPARQRSLQVLPLLRSILGESDQEVVLLDNIEILFEPTLHQRPIDVLKRLARTRTIVAAWCGTVTDGTLTYAMPGHPEYLDAPVQDALLVISGLAPGACPTNGPPGGTR